MRVYEETARNILVSRCYKYMCDKYNYTKYSHTILGYLMEYCLLCEINEDGIPTIISLYLDKSQESREAVKIFDEISKELLVYKEKMEG